MAAGTELDDLDLALEEPDLPGEPWFSRFRPLRALTLVAAGPELAASLVADIAAAPPWLGGELRVWEPTPGSADRVRSACQEGLAEAGWEVRADPDLPRALWGTDVVLHACSYLAPADREAVERATAGLGARCTAQVLEVAAALRTVSGQRRYASAFAHHARAVPVLTLTAPLAISTAQLAAARLPVMGVEPDWVAPTLRAMGGAAAEVPVWVVDRTRNPHLGDARHGHRVHARLVDTHREVLEDAPAGPSGERDELVLTAALDPVRRHVASALGACPDVPADAVAGLTDQVLHDFEDWLLWS